MRILIALILGLLPAASIARSVEDGAMVRVFWKAAGRAPLQGTVLGQDDDALELVDSGGWLRTVRFEDVTHIEVRTVRGSKAGTGVALGALGGGVAGFMFGYASGVDDEESCWFCWSREDGGLAFGLLGALAGGVVGAMVGGVMGVDGWERAYPAGESNPTEATALRIGGAPPGTDVGLTVHWVWGQ